MKHVVILGCENSHADMFLSFMGQGGYPEMTVIGAYSDDPTAMKRLQDNFGVSPMASFDEAVGKVDGVIITARHGDNHYKYAKPYLQDGTVMFIDKPITVSQDEALQLARDLNANNVRVTGGSCCKHIDIIQTLKQEHLSETGGKTVGGFFRAPVDLSNPYGDFFFYSQHLVEMVCEVYGYHPHAVHALTADGVINVIFRYDGFDVSGLYVHYNDAYFAARCSVSNTHAEEIVLDGDSACFRVELDEFYRLLLGGEQRRSTEEFIAPVFVLNAINRSMQSGKEEPVEEYVL